MLSKRFIFIGAAALLVLGSLACSISGGVTVEGPMASTEAGGEERTSPAEPLAEATPRPEPTEATEAPVVDTSAPTEAPPAEGPTAEPVPPTPPPPVEPPPDQDPLEVAEIPELEVTNLDPRGQGLGNLGTFRQRMRASYTATGSDYKGSYEYDADVNTAQQAVHVTVSGSSPAIDELPANTLQVIWIGTKAWFKIGNQPWLPYPESVQALPFSEQLYSAGSFMPYVLYFERVEPDETVNGILCAHYTYDVDNVPTQYGTVSGTGDVYVALDGGYVVRYTLDGSGTFDEYFVGQGTISLVYDTYDVGAGIDITPPRLR